jgi:hypothetical protein
MSVKVYIKMILKKNFQRYQVSVKLQKYYIVMEYSIIRQFLWPAFRYSLIYIRGGRGGNGTGFQSENMKVGS